MTPREVLQTGLESLGLGLDEPTRGALWEYAEELLRWNVRVNLTAITAPLEVAEKHLVDSLAVLPEVRGAKRLLDLGAGAGLPGVPLALALPELEVTLADSVGKKVAFIKAAAVKLGLTGRVVAVQVRAAGAPASEGLRTADVVISRALMDVGPWFALARHYLAPGGRVVAMLGAPPAPGSVEAAAEAAGLLVQKVRSFTLPRSGDPRSVVTAVARST